MAKKRGMLTITQTELRADPSRWALEIKTNDITVVRDDTKQTIMYLSHPQPRTLLERLKAAWDTFQNS